MKCRRLDEGACIFRKPVVSHIRIGLDIGIRKNGVAELHDRQEYENKERRLPILVGMLISVLLFLILFYWYILVGHKGNAGVHKCELTVPLPNPFLFLSIESAGILFCPSATPKRNSPSLTLMSGEDPKSLHKRACQLSFLS